MIAFFAPGLMLGKGGAGAPPPPAWTPTTPSGMVAWFDASVGVTASGGTISQWNDQSGNGYNLTQASSGLRPGYSATAWNGANPGITHNGSGLKFMINAGGLGSVWNSDNPLVFSFLFVVHPTTVPSTYSMVAAWRDDPTLNNVIAAGLSGAGDGSNSGACLTAGSAGAVDLLGSEDAADARLTQAIVYNGSGAAFYRNGSASGTASGTQTVSGQNQILLLCDQFGASNFNGVLSELIIYSSELSSTDAAGFHAYAAAKWGGLP